MYSDSFFAAETAVALRSAHAALPHVFKLVPHASVIDIGCGTGGWAYVAQHLGSVAIGVDHNVPDDLKLPVKMLDCDLTYGYPCTGFDLAICLEVAEHLEPRSGPDLVAGLCGANYSVLFSGATPGQPGVGHINCRPHAYWHLLFAQHGFVPDDRFDISSLTDVEDFYRRNCFLYRRVSE